MDGWPGHSYEAALRSVAASRVTAHHVSPHPKTISRLKGIELIAAQGMTVYLDLMKWEIITAWIWPIAHLPSRLSAHTKTLFQKIHQLLYTKDSLNTDIMTVFQLMSTQIYFIKDCTHFNWLIVKKYKYHRNHNFQIGGNYHRVWDNVACCSLIITLSQTIQWSNQWFIIIHNMILIFIILFYLFNRTMTMIMFVTVCLLLTKTTKNIFINWNKAEIKYT